MGGMIYPLLLAILIVLWIISGIYFKRYSKFRYEASWFYAFFRPICVILCALCYRRRTLGEGNIPSTGGCIIIANHMSYADVVCLGLACPRPLRYVSWSGLEKHFLLRVLMRAMNTIPISPANAKDGMKAAVDAVKSGQVVCIFPEGCMTRNGSLQPFMGGFQVVARKADVPVVPAYIDGLWYSIFSYRRKKFIWKKPRISRLPVTIAFGKPFKMGKREGEKTYQQMRSIVLELGTKVFSAREELKGHLAATLTDACARRPFKTAIIDRSVGRRTMSRGILFAASMCLAHRFKKELHERRVGLVLPPGLAGMVANYACTLAGKIPVNLNFTLGRAQLESCLARASIKTVITVGAMKKQLNDRFPDFPWPDCQIDILDEIKQLPKLKLLGIFAMTVLLPSFALKKIFSIPTKVGAEEATILFTSGSSGMPKGAVISHKNILANCAQIDEYDVLPPNTRLLGNLPIFHSFGYTVQLWFAPTSDEVLAVSTPSPLDFAKNLQVIREERCTVLLSTPTFLRNYLKKAPPEYLMTVDLVVGGAEKTPAGFAEAWEEKFSLAPTRYLEGYGMTEASPVVAVNKPDVVERATGNVHRGMKKGSVGVLFPGMNDKVFHTETGEILPYNEPGMLYLKGPNIFEGYINDEGVPVPVTDAKGWYESGDIVEMDKYGFISIKGRLSRFSKIGGEMVPHGSVEEAIQEILNLSNETLQLAVAGRPDPQKGEALVIVTTIENLDVQALGRKLADAGFPNLWIPREVKVIPEMPVLGTGKLDIKSLSDIAKG
ncbi:MAG: AMP-binding protein [Opitutales bacterium]|nr:AMP-binding protein [Opitutales bacterium]